MMMMMMMMTEEEEGGEGNTQSSGPGLWGRSLSNTCLHMRQDEGKWRGLPAGKELTI